MPIQKIAMNFYKNVRPIESDIADESFNTRAPTAKYYRKTCACCETPYLINQVFKNVTTCYCNITKSANTAFPIDQNTGKRVDYSQSRSEYLHSRCKTFNQNSFNFDFNPTNCCNCNPVYKPNNAKYTTQGAVSSSARLLRLKYNNITTNAKYNANQPRYRGDLTNNVFINKSPMCKKC